jgi:DNA-directed RNA polymerase
VLKVNVERNLLGAVSSAVGSANHTEENAPVTGEIETNPPEPGRPGQVRGKNFPSDPPIAPFIPSKLMPQYSSDVLDNGLKVMVVPNHEVPFVSVQLGLLSGAWTEEKPGTAAMTMQMLTKGSAKHTEGELAEELETYAISLQGAGQMDTATVNMSCLTEHIDRAMGLFGEVTLTPTFSPEEFEKLRGQVLTSLAVASGEPEYIAEREFRKRLYGEHPYARTPIGEVEDVNALALGDLNQFWKQFVRPESSVLIFAGDIERDRALELAKKTLGNWKVEKPAQQVELAELPEIGGTSIYLVDRPGSVQSQIRAGQRGITRRMDGYFVSRVVSSYFGWSFNSRLNQSIRVDKGLTYGVWGSYTAQRFAGEFAVGTFSRTESTAAAVQAVIEEIIRLRDDSPSEEELSSSKSFLLGTFVKDRETPQQIASDLWLIESERLGADYMERLLGTVARAERADCEKLVDRTLEPDKLVIVVVGEADKIRDELEKTAPVTVIPTENR